MPTLDAHIVKRRRVLAVDLCLRLEQGERLALFGASGAGKSTVLSCLAGIENPDAGRIQFGDTVFFPPHLPLYLRPLAYLTQSDSLFPHLSVADNVCFGLRDRASDGTRHWVEELKRRLALGPLWNESARRISGGQARRVALARMLARRPPLVLLDEPFTALDRPIVGELVDAILQWHRELGFTLIAVDHRADILERLCTRAAAIEDGRVIQAGTWPEITSAPATPTLARLLSA
ncbi:MAG TPA: ATP-binding cassette domain-containing protein [Candidatus Binataceae bacterium]|nr:ATP-binding cassette domain-containing protein [Candidatus Binataceae bacterium]